MKKCLCFLSILTFFPAGAYAFFAHPPVNDLQMPLDVDRLSDGSIIVTDAGDGSTSGFIGSKIICISPDKEFLWVYDKGLKFAHSADLQDNGNLIISDTHNDRVIEVDPDFNIIWNTDEIEFSDGSHIDYPNDANILDGDTVLITDRNNHRAFETDRQGNILWQFGVTGVGGADDTHMKGPHNADRLDNGNTIIADSNNNRIIEITPSGEIVWVYDQDLIWPRDADRLDNGNTLIADSHSQRVIEVTLSGEIVWSYRVTEPYDANRLDNGNTLISDALTARIIEVNPDKEIVWEYSWRSSFTLELDASYEEGTISMTFTLGTLERATWEHYLILTFPQTQVIPLWAVQIPVIDHPIEIPVAFPFHGSGGWIGNYTYLLPAGGGYVRERKWIATGM